MIPIKWDYFIKNKYLTTNFDAFATLHQYYQITDKASNITIKNIGGNTLFYLKKTQAGFFFEYSWITILSRFIAMFCFLYFINQVFAKLIP